MLMRFVALLEDKPDTGALRDAHQAAHEAFLRTHKGTILMAGALREQADARPIGGLWLFEADSKQAVEVIIAEDPFYKAGMRATIRVLDWRTVPGFENMVVGPKTQAV